MTSTRLTKRVVEQVQAGTKEQILWDDDVTGFGVRVRPSGKRVYIFKYRTLDGLQGKLTLGTHGNLTVDQARTLAKKHAHAVSQGANPARDKSELRAAPSLADLCDRYLLQHAKPHKKARSADSDGKLIENHIKPRLGKLAAHTITRADISELHHDLRETPYQANRVLALLSKMLNLSEVWGIRPDGSNPCRHIKKYKEEKRERFLSPRELAVLNDTLAHDASAAGLSKSAIAAIKLLVLTGCRLSEILTLQWEWVDFESGCLRLPDSKSGKKVVQLGAPALAILSAMETEDGNPFVVIGQKTGSHLINLEKPWRIVRDRATVRIWKAGIDPLNQLIKALEDQLDRTPTIPECTRAAEIAKVKLPTGMLDVRLHDLRHTFASFGASANLSLPMIGKLLGHTQAQTTARYAHLASDPVKHSADIVAKAVDAAMRGVSAEIIPLQRAAE